MAFNWGMGPATPRILKRYGTRSGSIINATGTGTTIVLSVNNYYKYVSGIEDIFDSEGKLQITAFSSFGSPIKPHQLGIMGCKRALSGALLPYRRSPTVDIDITVIGNSLDFYRLSMLASFYMSRTVRVYVPHENVDPEIDKSGGHTEERAKIPLLDMQIVSNSAPGSNVTLSGGVIVDANPIMGIDGNARIGDRTFSFSFSSVKPVSWSDQKYDPDESPSFLDNLIGL